MNQSNQDNIPYSDDALKPLFEGWFEREDKKKKAELMRLIEIEILVEVEEQMPFIRRICQSYPAADPEDLRVHVERHARNLAFRRKHRNPSEPSGDVDKRLRNYWNDPKKREAYPDLYAQIQHVVWSLVREAITQNPVLTSLRDENWLGILYWKFVRQEAEPSKGDGAILEILFGVYDEGGFSDDEKKYIHFILESEGDSLPTDSQIEGTFSWYQSKAHRVKKAIARKIRQKLRIRRDINEQI